MAGTRFIEAVGRRRGVLLGAAVALSAASSGRAHAEQPARAPLATRPAAAVSPPDTTALAPAATPAPPGDRSGLGPPPREAEAAPFALDLTAATWIPLSVGPELSVELPGRILAQVHVGWMPELYSQALTDTLEDAGVYDADVGDLVDGAVRGATTWRLAAGWRPFPRAGLELTVGYAHVALDGGTNVSELVPLVTPDVAEELQNELGNADIDLDSSIHHFTIAAGWRWLIAKRVVIRANLGYLQAFAASSRLDIESRPDLTALAEPTVRAILHDNYMRYIKVPVVGLGVGYHF